jgi:hypothetical protein
MANKQFRVVVCDMDEPEVVGSVRFSVGDRHLDKFKSIKIKKDLVVFTIEGELIEGRWAFLTVDEVSYSGGALPIENISKINNYWKIDLTDCDPTSFISKRNKRNG